MVKGPFNGPRPFAEHRLIFDPHRMDIFVVNTGPLGGPRPFSKLNPEVEQSRIRECVMSEAGQNFAVGQSGMSDADSITDLPPQQAQAALEVAEDWCEGILEATAQENLSEEEVVRRFEDTVDAIDVAIQGELAEESIEEAAQEVETGVPTEA